jgi:hypothetical protein
MGVLVGPAVGDTAATGALVTVGGTAVLVGAALVAVGGTAVLVGAALVAVGGTAVLVGAGFVAVGGTGVGVGVAPQALRMVDARIRITTST